MIRLSEWGIVLGTRKIGRDIRRALLNKMEAEDQPIVISFEGILMVSNSFADECFGKLIAAIGREEFKKAFKIADLNDDMIRKILNSSVNERLALEFRNS